MADYKAIVCAVLMTALAAAPVMAAGKKKPVRKVRLKTETLACRLGTEDRHARIAVVLVGGKTDSFAYYSKWKPRTCSIYLQRARDPYSTWADNGAITTVSLEKGAFLIEHKKGEYHFIFRDVDRERYCGMDGVINGGLTIKKGRDQCVLEGDIMAEGSPLGTPVAGRAIEAPEPAEGASDVAPQPAPETASTEAAASTVKPLAKAASVANTETASAQTSAASQAAAASSATETPAAPASPAATASAASKETQAAAAAPDAAATTAAAANANPKEPATTTAAAPQDASEPVNPFRAFWRAVSGTPTETTP